MAETARPVSGLVALTAGILAVGIPLPFSPASAGPGTIGLLALVVALLTGRRRLLTLSATGLVGVGLVAGIGGATAPILLSSVACALLAASLARRSLRYGAAVQPGASTVRAELVHVAAMTGVATIGAALAYGVSTTEGPTAPMAAVALVALGAVGLVLALR